MRYRKTHTISTAIVVLCQLFAGSSSALSAKQIKVLKSGVYYYNTEDSGFCNDSGVTSQGLGPEREGHKLPASSGGIGKEEAAVITNGRAVLAPGTSNPGAGLSLKPAGMTQNDADFYINMRWRYALWAWDGTSKTSNAPESSSWYSKTVRKIKVTDPSTGKSVVTSVLESGPAPWTGTAGGSKTIRSAPSYWQGYVDGTPDGYDGRVGGLSPKAFAALGNPKLQWDAASGSKNPVTFEWVDEATPAGATGSADVAITAASVPSASNSVACGDTAGTVLGNYTIYSQYDPKWRNNPYGSSNIGASGCAPSSMAMAITYLTGKQVTPADVTAFANKNNLYIEGSGSSWSIVKLAAENWGLKAVDAGVDINTVVSGVKSGGVGIVTGKGALPFTSAGHFISVRGVDANGDLMLGDPAHPDANTKPWSTADIMKDAGNMWVITK